MVLQGLPKRYTIKNQIGCGGMGQVYEVYDNELQRAVALKTLRTDRLGDDRLIKRFQQEAQALARVHHPNIVQIHDIGTTTNSFYYTMDLIEGHSLADMLKRGPLPESECLRIAHSLSDGLQAMHKASLVHRDIKPENIIITEKGDLYLIDFGLVKSFSPENTARLTKSEELVGTLLYMSPEQVLGRKVGPASDIFQFGLTLYEALTAQRALNPLQIAAIARETDCIPIEPPSKFRKDIDPRLETVICKAIEYEPLDRWSSATEIQRELSKTLSVEDETILASKPSIQKPAKITGFSKIYFVPVFLSVVLLLFLFWPHKDYRISMFEIRERGAHSVLLAWQTNWKSRTIDVRLRGGDEETIRSLTVESASTALLDSLKASSSYDVCLIKPDGSTSMPINFKTRKYERFELRKLSSIDDDGKIICSLESQLPFTLLERETTDFKRRFSFAIPLTEKTRVVKVRSIDGHQKITELNPQLLAKRVLDNLFINFIEAHGRNRAFREKSGHWIKLTSHLSRKTTSGALAGEWQLLWTEVCRKELWARRLNGQLPGIFRLVNNESVPHILKASTANALLPLRLLNEAARWSHLNPNPAWQSLPTPSTVEPAINNASHIIKGRVQKAPLLKTRVLVCPHHPHVQTFVAKKTVTFASDDIFEFTIPQGGHRRAELELSLHSAFRGSAIIAEYGEKPSFGYFLCSDKQWDEYNVWLIETASFGSILLALDEDYTDPNRFSQTSSLISKMCPPKPIKAYLTIPAATITQKRFKVRLRVVSGPIKEPQGVILSDLLLRLAS